MLIIDTLSADYAAIAIDYGLLMPLRY